LPPMYVVLGNWKTVSILFSIPSMSIDLKISLSDSSLDMLLIPRGSILAAM